MTIEASGHHHFGSYVNEDLDTELFLTLSSSVPGCMPDGGYPHTLPPAPAETSYDEDWEVFDP